MTLNCYIYNKKLNNCYNMKNILVLGLGKVGTLVGVLLSKNFNVSGLDQNKPHYDFKLPFNVIETDVKNKENLINIFKDFDTVVSALPFFLNKNINKTSIQVYYKYRTYPF